jgi:hypothetical protein
MDARPSSIGDRPFPTLSLALLATRLPKMNKRLGLSVTEARLSLLPEASLMIYLTSSSEKIFCDDTETIALPRAIYN